MDMELKINGTLFKAKVQLALHSNMSKKPGLVLKLPSVRTCNKLPPKDQDVCNIHLIY